MTSETFILFLTAIGLNSYTYIKLFKKSALNAFDLISIFQSLYFIVIPLQSIFQNVYYREIPFKDIVNQHPVTLIYYNIFCLALSITNYFWTTSYRNKVSVINITGYLKLLDKSVQISSSLIYLSAVVFILFLYPIINYSSLSADNIEGNLTYRYALNMPFYQRMIVSTVSETFPVFVLIVIKYLKDQKQNRSIAYLALGIAIACALLGTRTLLLFSVVVVMLYLYSVKKSFFNLKRTIYGLIIIVLLTTIFFPISLAFRETKQTTVEGGQKHSFFDVASKFSSLSSKDRAALLQTASDQTKGRSLNVYIAFDEVCTKKYKSTNGNLTIEQLKSINPLIKPDPKYENIIANTLEGYDTDIAESVLTTFTFDLGIIGIFVGVFFFFAYILFLGFIKDLFYLIFHDMRINLLYLVYVINFCYSVEIVPAIRTIYNPNVIVLLTLSLMLYILDTFFSKKTNYSLIGQHH